MPLAQIYVMEGRTEEQKRQLVAAVTEAIQASVGAPADAVRVAGLSRVQAPLGVSRVDWPSHRASTQVHSFG